VLTIDPNPANAKMLAELLRSLDLHCQVLTAATDDRAFSFLDGFNPQLIFVEYKGPHLDGLAFTRRLRRSDLACREAPVIVVTAEATAAAIMGSRDAGVHEFLRRPFNMGDLKKRIEAVTLRPRDWIEAINYIGPDRRRFNSADYKGPRKRRAEGTSPTGERVGQALKIIQAALSALESDPKQAVRALRAQAKILAELSANDEGLKSMRSVAVALEQYLQQVAAAYSPSREQIQTFAAQLAAAAPEAASAKAA
jgi:CheY-like chemotaxis protein